MNEELKQKVIEHMKKLHERIGETISIEDWISTSGRNYDRHQTRYGRQLIQVQDFTIRYSGSIATIRSEHQQIEFRTDSIKFIQQKDNDLLIEINMVGDVWRRIKISAINSTKPLGI